MWSWFGLHPARLLFAIKVSKHVWIVDKAARLRKIKRPIDGSTVLHNLRQGPPRSILNRVIRHDKANHWWEGLESCFNEVLAPWTASDDPVNAWDAFLVNQVSQHYAFTGMMSVRAVANLRMPAFDNEVFGVYLSMSPGQRVSGAAVYFALEKISTELSVIPNANTGFRAGIGPLERDICFAW